MDFNGLENQFDKLHNSNFNQKTVTYKDTDDEYVKALVDVIEIFETKEVFGKNIVSILFNGKNCLAYIDDEDKIDVINDYDDFMDIAIRETSSYNYRKKALPEAPQGNKVEDYDVDIVENERRIIRTKKELLELLNESSKVTSDEFKIEFINKMEERMGKPLDTTTRKYIEDKLKKITKKMTTDLQVEIDGKKEIINIIEETLNKNNSYLIENKRIYEQMQTNIKQAIRAICTANNMNMNTRRLTSKERQAIMEYEKLKGEQEVLNILKSTKYALYSSRGDITSGEQKKLDKLSAERDGINKKIDKILKKYPGIDSFTIFSNDNFIDLLVENRKMDELNKYIEKTLENENKIKNIRSRHSDQKSALLEKYEGNPEKLYQESKKLARRERYEDSVLYDIVTGIKSSWLLGKIKESKIVTGKLPTKISSYVKDKKMKIKKMSSTYNSMVDDLESYNKRNR